MAAIDKKFMAKGPEFLFNSRQPSIRLKAPVTQRSKKLFRHLLEKNVLVILLNGQRVDVSCRTDATAENIFESVSVHTNLNERHFFGLTLLRDGEHFFLEPEQRLEKFGPPGWRNQNRHILNARILFTLYLRVKYYPITLDFVKTEQTLHHIYLQLRRDILDERLQCTRQAACYLASLALQAEFGDLKLVAIDNFMLSHYMPDRHFLSEVGLEDSARKEILDCWLKNAQMNQRDAEINYVKFCQTLREYGIHFHRLYRTKPSTLLTPSPLGDPDTGTPLWIGVMPRGIIIFEERDGERIPISQHPWHATDTLQFDHKRFMIFPHSENPTEVQKYVYYTDDYKKSMYFVNFAAGQHRFCMKMRTWAATLPLDRDSADHRQTNGKPVELDSHARNVNPGDELSNGDQEQQQRQPIPAARHRERGVDLASNATPFNITPKVARPDAAPKSGPLNEIAVSTATPDEATILSSGPDASAFFVNPNETVTASLNERLNNAANSPLSAYSDLDYETFNVTLTKDPHFGLGLTLVDGEIEKMEGVYVRSITPGGPAHLIGRLRVGDRVVSVNGVSLEGKGRHNAVDLVRQSTSQVQMGILRLPYLYDSSESIENQGTASTPSVGHSTTASQNAQDDNGVKSDINAADKNADDSTTKKRRFEKSPMISNNRKRVDKVAAAADISISPAALRQSSSTDGANFSSSTPQPAPKTTTAAIDASASKKKFPTTTTTTTPKNEPSPLDDNTIDGRPSQHSMIWLNDTSSAGGVSFYSRTLSALDESSTKMYGGLHQSDDDDDDDDDADSSSQSSQHGGENAGRDKNKSSKHRLSDVAGDSTTSTGGGSANNVNGSSGGKTGNNRRYVRGSKSSLGTTTTGDDPLIMKRRRDKEKLILAGSSATSLAQSSNNNNTNQNQPMIKDRKSGGGGGNSKSRSMTSLSNDDSPTGLSFSHDLTNRNKDWTENLSLSKSAADGATDDLELVSVSLMKNEHGSLGIQVAGGKGQKKVYIKSVVAEPALSCKDIQPGDQLVTINEISIRGLSHYEVVDFLKNAKSPVHLGLLRAKKVNSHPEKENQILLTETFDVMLEKPASGSLGLSLARPPNSEGIFIRVIAPGSVAARDGRLKVGDRLWMINGDSVANCSPAEVVEKLKAAQGFVKLVLKREIKDSDALATM